MSECISSLLSSLIDRIVSEEEEMSEGDSSSVARRSQSAKVFEDLQQLAEEVEERLEAIENTERELDRWRDEQLKKNRLFWDEYRRQVENYSSSRLLTLQYDFTRREQLNGRLIRRLKRAECLSSSVDLFSSQTLSDHFSPSLLAFLSSLALDPQSNDDEGDELPEDLLSSLSEHSSLDEILLATDLADEQFDEDLEQSLEL